MDISKDVCTLDELEKGAKQVIRNVETNKRPFMVMSNGKPGVLIIPAGIMKTQLTALKAVCELAEV